MGEDSKIKQEGNNFNPKGGKPKFCPITQWTYKSKIADLEDATFNCGCTSDTAKFEGSKKVITRYVILKYKSGVYLSEIMINGKLPDITIP